LALAGAAAAFKTDSYEKGPIEVKNRFGLDVSYNKPDFGDFSKELLLDKVRDFFSLDNVGTTWLGKVMAWKGDLMQPAALFGLGVFAIYTFFRIVLTLFGDVINLKTGLLGRLFTMLNNVNDKFLDKLVGPMDDDEPEVEVEVSRRRKREIMRLTERVFDAINKFD